MGRGEEEVQIMYTSSYIFRIQNLPLLVILLEIMKKVWEEKLNAQLSL